MRSLDLLGDPSAVAGSETGPTRQNEKKTVPELGTPERPAVIALRNLPQSDTQAAGAETQRKHEQDKEERDQRTLYVAAGGLAVSIGLLFVGALGVRAALRTLGAIEDQARIMGDQHTAMKEQLAQMTSAGQQTNALIKHAEGQVMALTQVADATLKSAAAATDGLKAMMDKERARIRVLPVSVQHGAKFDEVVVRTLCYGTTEAFIKNALARAVVTQSGDWAGYPRDFAPLLMPSVRKQDYDGTLVSVYLAGTYYPERIFAGTDFIHIWGRVDYEDIFGNPRHTSFRWCYGLWEEVRGVRSVYWKPCDVPGQNEER